MILFVGSSSGLANNDQRSYSELLDVGADQKGLFSVAEFNAPWKHLRVRAGAWHNSADQPRLNGTGTDDGHGFDTSVDGHYDGLTWNLRTGHASDQVNEIEQFTSLALSYLIENHSIGIAYARSQLSDDITGIGSHNIKQAEIVYGTLYDTGFELSASMQWLNNPLFSSRVLQAARWPSS